jgi:hypothetical protein
MCLRLIHAPGSSAANSIRQRPPGTGIQNGLLDGSSRIVVQRGSTLIEATCAPRINPTQNPVNAL